MVWTRAVGHWTPTGVSNNRPHVVVSDMTKAIVIATQRIDESYRYVSTTIT